MALTLPSGWRVAALLAAPSLFALVVGVAIYGWIASGYGALRTAEALGAAIEAGHRDTILRLLASGADPNGRFRYRHAKINGGERFEATALTIAAATGRESVVRMVLDAGAKIDAPGNGMALCAAVALDHGNVQLLLIERGLDPNPQTKCDGGRRSPLRLAIDGGQDEMAQRLRTAGALEDY